MFATCTDDGARQYREVYLEVGKKNGKSTLCAGIALYLLAADGEPGAEIYIAATTRDQASIVFREAASMVDSSPLLTKSLRVLRSTKTILKRDDPNSFLRAVAADGDAVDGVNPHAVIFDELHRWKQPKALELYEVLTRGTIARRQPLTVAITTAGVPDEAPICWPKHKYARNIEKGIIADPRFYGRIYGIEAEEAQGDGWLDPETWKRANPSLGSAFPLEALADLALKAQNDPTQKPHFLRYHLGVWGQHEQRAIEMTDWDKCPRGPSLDEMQGRVCYAGLDLSYKYDLCALTLLFPDDDGQTFHVFPFFWLPQERLADAGKKDKVPYALWAEQGYLETTPGQVIDQRVIEEKIEWAQKTFELREVGFDKWHAIELAIRMNERCGIEFVPVPQAFQMSESTKKVIELVKSAGLSHGSHPLLRWNADCLSLEDDGNNNIKPVKPVRQQSDKRIDGMVALCMAMDRAIRNGYGRISVYEERGVQYI